MLFFEKIKQKLSNKKIKSNKQIEEILELKTIAEIPLKQEVNAAELIEYENEKNNLFKAFKKMVTNIQFLCVNNVTDKKVMLVTSPKQGEGKSYITANLAVAFSKIGKKVLVIDADLTNGRQDKIFNIPNNLGLSNYLSGLDSNGLEINEFLSKFINETSTKNVNLITYGTVPPNPSELLASKKLTELIKDAKVFFDIILIDSSEILDKKEYVELVKNTNSIILVAEAEKTTIEELKIAQKELESIKGKILGVVINCIKLPKEKKTKKQRKEDFIKFKLSVKQKFDNTIENIKRKLNQLNQKLLEEPKQTSEIVEEIVIKENEEITENINTEENKKDNNISITDSIKENEIKEDDKFIELKNKFSNIKSTINTNFSSMKSSVSEKKEIVKNKFTEIKNSKFIKEEKKEILNGIKEETSNNCEENKVVISENKVEVKEEHNDEINENKEQEIKNKINFENVKENIINISEKTKEFFKVKIDSLKNIKKEKANKNDKTENIEKEDTENIIKIEKNKENTVNASKNENMILIIVDAENGYCRIFSKDYFVEKTIRGNKNLDFSRPNYSMRNLRRKKQYFSERYQMTENQTSRIDVLVYDALKDYDEYQWIERKIPSDKAENYALAISKEFEKELNESEKEYKARCQRLRKAELQKAELDIEYKLDNLWTTSKISILDKILISKFSRIYEIEKNMKNDSEIMKSKKNKKFYTDIIKGAEKRFEKAKKEDIRKEEKEKKVIEEDRKIKQEELILEKQQLEYERKAAQERIRLEQENVRAEKKAEIERIKEEKRKEREIERIEKKEENARRKREKQKQKEDAKFQKERERLKQIEEAKIEEELLEDNLYPKTKNNKNL